MDIAIYVSLAFGIVRAVRMIQPQVRDTVTAFGFLEKALRKKFPDLPAGFTWREGVERARLLNLKVSWEEIQGALAQYERFRYGGGSKPEPAPAEVVKLARILSGGVRLGN
ncbi:MAG: hypothetical protein OK422_04030 [Thaumarchaeota archaeon]|nr:hypothetical protein [Nitrososphaerota archaeon]